MFKKKERIHNTDYQKLKLQMMENSFYFIIVDLFNQL